MSNTKSRKKKRISKRLATPTKRTQVVWAVFAGAMTIVIGLLALREGNARSGFLLTNVQAIGSLPSIDPILQISRPLDRKRWTEIVIHHSASPAGDAESIHRRHLAHGLQGLGYHFVVGNGNGLGDGIVHVGYRWNEQLPGAHVSGPNQSYHNEHGIGICLVGNGDRRPFTERQIAQLVSLVQRLQDELNIPARNVHLHRDLSAHTSSPGKSFPAARFHEQLLN